MLADRVAEPNQISQRVIVGRVVLSSLAPEARDGLAESVGYVPNAFAYGPASLARLALSLPLCGGRQCL